MYSRITLAPTYYRGCWHVVVSRGFLRSTVMVLPSLKAVYVTNDFVPHAASLRQGCPHCAKFPTAASRRVWAVSQSQCGRRPLSLATRCGHGGPLPRRLPDGPRPHPLPPGAFPAPCGGPSIGISLGFPRLSRRRGAGWSRVTHPFATLSTPEGVLLVRLACVRRAASVHPEPGSNSPWKVEGGCPQILVD